MKESKTVLEEVVELADDTTKSVSEVVTRTEHSLERTVSPVRKHVLKRFPTLFLLLVAFAFTATVTGMEQLLLQIDFLQNNPGLLFIIGLVLLVVTGTLYRKLG